MSSPVIPNDVSCDLYHRGFCNLYDDKYCIGSRCVVWNAYKDKQDLKASLAEKQSQIETEVEKIITLLRLLCHSENSRLYVMGNIHVVEYVDGEQTYCYPLFDESRFIRDTFFDLPLIEGELPPDFSFDAKRYFQKMGFGEGN